MRSVFVSIFINDFYLACILIKFKYQLEDLKKTNEELEKKLEYLQTHSDFFEIIQFYENQLNEYQVKNISNIEMFS